MNFSEVWEEYNEILLLILLAIVLLGLAAVQVLGEPATLTAERNVSIVCGNTSQCIAFYDGGLPIFFEGTGNATLRVPFTFVYEPNVVVVQNVTVLNVSGNASNCSLVQNVTINVTTQNVTVISCNQSALPLMNVSVEKIQEELMLAVGGNLSASCRQACAVSDDEKDALNQATREAQASEQRVRVTCEATLNVTRIQYDTLNSTCSAEKDDLKGLLWTGGGVGILAVAICCVVLLAVMHRARVKRGTSGRSGRAEGGRE